jgi:hypothetical protein
MLWYSLCSAFCKVVYFVGPDYMNFDCMACAWGGGSMKTRSCSQDFVQHILHIT